MDFEFHEESSSRGVGLKYPSMRMTLWRSGAPEPTSLVRRYITVLVNFIAAVIACLQPSSGPMVVFVEVSNEDRCIGNAWCGLNHGYGAEPCGVFTRHTLSVCHEESVEGWPLRSVATWRV